MLTSTFTHVEIWHIGFNMLALWVLGPQLELAIGRARFLALYLLSGLAGSALVYWAAPVNQSTLGASGAVFGLMAALLVVAFKVKADYQQILIWIGINAVLTFVFGFSWQGHLGGFLGGLAIAGILVYAPRPAAPCGRWSACPWSACSCSSRSSRAPWPSQPDRPPALGYMAVVLPRVWTHLGITTAL